MSRLIEIAGIAGFFLAAVLPAQALPIYTTADFSGGITNVTKHGDELGLQRTKSCPDCPEGFVGGHLTFDSGLIPGAGSGVVNVLLTEVSGASNDLIFDMVFGGKPLEFQFGDKEIQGAPSIQFKDGVFNGFQFVGDFSVNGKSFELSMQGGTWDIKAMNSNGVYSHLAASGQLNIGSGGLTNQQIFSPPSEPLPELPNATVPEPATLALLGLGFLGLVIGRRTRQ